MGWKCLERLVKKAEKVSIKGAIKGGIDGGQKYEKGDVLGMAAYLKQALDIPNTPNTLTKTGIKTAENDQNEGKNDKVGAGVGDGDIIRNATEDIISARKVLFWLAKDVVEPSLYVYIYVLYVCLCIYVCTGYRCMCACMKTW